MKSFHCHPCGKVFTSKLKLRSHLFRLKTGTKLYKCQTCLLEFSRRKTLVLHEALHEENIIRPEVFKCKLCSRTFTSASSLENHFAVHRKGAMHRCQKCLITFVDNTDLKLHMNKKHKEKDSLSCDNCMCVFSGETQLSRHVQKVHVGSDPQGCKKCSNYSEEDYLRQLADCF